MYIISLDSVDLQAQGVGQKAASLGELAKKGFLVPKGFVVTTEAFQKFLTDTGIGLALPKILEGVNTEDPKSAASASSQIKEMFARYSGTDFLIRDVKSAYNELSFGKDVSIAGGAALDLIRAGRGECFVSIRPSVVSSKPAGFAGHGKACLNLIGSRQILAGIKDCWLSFYSPEALVYRKLHGTGDATLAVLVQKMADSELSGNLFTQDPVTGEGKILVEGWWGLGETLCCGCVSPDQYVLEKNGAQISRRTGKKLWLRRRGPLSGTTIQEKVPGNRVSIDTLGERDLPKFAAIASKLEEILKGPQHAEWAVERGRIAILQSSPVTFSKRAGDAPAPADEGQISIRGIGVSPGSAGGKAKAANDISAMQKPTEPSILVVKTLSISLLPFARWFSGIVSEQGGAGSCMASVGRELGIPIVCGVENAGIILDGKSVTLDGRKGEVCFSQA